MADEQPTQQPIEQPTEPVLKEFSREEVAKHTTAEDCWMIIKDDGLRKVYDVTKFLDDHPGGPEIMLDLAGQDATDEFEDIGHSNDARAQLQEWLIGKVEGEVKEEKKVTKKVGGSSSGEKSSSGNLAGFVVISVAVAAVALFFQFGN